MSKVVRETLVGWIVPFVLGALGVAFLQEPVYDRVIPYIMTQLDKRDQLIVFNDYSDDPEKRWTYSIYASADAEKISGRMMDATDGKDDFNSQFQIKGFRKPDYMTFAFWSTKVSQVGGGEFFGSWQANEKSFAGHLIGEAKNGNNECELRVFPAIYTKETDPVKLAALENAARRNVPQFPMSGARVSCPASKGQKIALNPANHPTN